MRIIVRSLLVSAALVLLLASAGCKGVTPPSIREDSQAESAQSAATEAQPAESGNQAEASTAATEAQATQPPAEAPAGSEEPKAKSDALAGTESAGDTAVGAELQRTKNWVLGGKLWAMAIDGKADVSTPQPKVQLIAVDKKGNKKLIAEIPGAKGAASLQGTFKVPVPAGSAHVLVTTTLHPGGSTVVPTLDLDLSEVPVVDKLTLAGDQ